MASSTSGPPPKSPFFAPSTPRKLVPISTPGGTSRLVKVTPPNAAVREHKSTVWGATSNLVNAIVGAGIVGIPFAFKETGLVAGIFLVILCAILTEKSLRVLIDTAKHVNVPSYEMLFESTYGSFGFYFISVNMLIMAYGGCLSYLMIIKDTLPVLLGTERGDVGMERAVLTVSTMAIILPISMQRDMADLAKTSKISVIFQCTMVLVVVLFAPVSSSVSARGGLFEIASHSIVEHRVFVGLGVLSFAYVCQHSAFIVAGSLDRPSGGRWAMATGRALGLCVVLEAAIGVAGYLAFLDDTEGDILNNFMDLGGDGMKRAGNVARGLMCTTMFFVYPMDSFVCRHVLVVLFFRGRRAHEGDDASVLARRDRRVAITLIVYFSSLIPALMVDNVGSVLAITGTIGASCLAYIGPGLIYMAVYGDKFLVKVDEVWGPPAEDENQPPQDVESSQLLPSTNKGSESTKSSPSPTKTIMQGLAKDAAWYLLLMPLWCSIAETGKKKLSDFQEKEALKSPHINRLGKEARSNGMEMPPVPEEQERRRRPRGGSSGSLSSSMTSGGAGSGPKILPYGAVISGGGGGNKAIGAAILAKKRSGGDTAGKNRGGGEGEDNVDITDVPPAWSDFCVAIFFIVFGMVALCAGMVSILMTN
eukprot:CAMPEP_0181080310 /NCGR_PEP_ID=MMETSP1071-20121207/2498_1 /TAXON_ID=35127 /ORGANISM="Thalassiosira sp., Strain NH16" /LENGTH=646 /DNA_ID=CAMNT_0023161777 /DNA_START=227 /DNA_END=2167 /DNA_ORIENTATION=+